MRNNPAQIRRSSSGKRSATGVKYEIIPTDGVANPRMKDGIFKTGSAWKRIRGIATPSVGIFRFSEARQVLQ